MDFGYWLWLGFPFLVFGALNLKKEACPLEESLFSKQKWGLFDCISLLALVVLSLEVLKTVFGYLLTLPSGSIEILRGLCRLTVLFIYIRYKLKQPFFNLGLHDHSLPANILSGLKGILPWILIFTVLGLSISTYFDPPLMNASSRWSLQWLGGRQIGGPLIVFLIGLTSLVVLSPLQEELIFRGFFYGPIRRRVNRIMAIFLSSAVFTSFHTPPSAHWPLVVFPLGCLYAYLYENRQSLIPSIAAHSFWNLNSFLRKSYNLNRLPLIPPGHLVGFLSVLFVGQAILLLIVLYLYRRVEGEKGKQLPDRY